MLIAALILAATTQAELTSGDRVVILHLTLGEHATTSAVVDDAVLLGGAESQAIAFDIAPYGKRRVLDDVP